MLKKTVTYEDFNGVQKTEDFYFHFNEPELMEMELGIDGGLSDMVSRISATKNSKVILATFKDLVSKAYGVKAADGVRFEKSEELSKAFREHPAYPIIFMELATNDAAAAEFVNGVLPEKIKKIVAERKAAEAAVSGPVAAN